MRDSTTNGQALEPKWGYAEWGYTERAHAAAAHPGPSGRGWADLSL